MDLNGYSGDRRLPFRKVCGKLFVVGVNVDNRQNQFSFSRKIRKVSAVFKE